jgi:plastocyanin
MRLLEGRMAAVCTTATTALVIGCGGDAGDRQGVDDGVDGPSVINGCREASYVDGGGGTPIIRFGGDLDDRYSPACITVKLEQEVGWSGDFEEHPLSPGVAPSIRSASDPGTTPNPIPTQESGTTTITTTFGAIGHFPYYRTDHEDDGMYGTVQVVPQVVSPARTSSGSRRRRRLTGRHPRRAAGGGTGGG